ncbi:T-cell immunoreceptor with Ig and ITIM domains [Carlito syrichta]|uniref:T-cell immunoreceptor with Ig and ITIM domains n=1 Tax=Carlito syrichta TaxID=1868482 RepID=UPI00046B18C3|nr:T-cell immunoreceptor with Ig and ITIM domains [Carlito syrichta]
MQWCLLLFWAQGLRQGPLALGAMPGTIVTTGNISTEEGGSVILQCHLSSTMAEVTQVIWEQQDQLLATHHAELGWHIQPAFRERVVLGPSQGLTLQSLTMNDTGEYFCIYHTYPDGIYRGRIFLKVLANSVAKHHTAIQIPLLGAMATVVICTAVIGVVMLIRKRKSLQTRYVESDFRTPAGQEEWDSSIPLGPRTCVLVEAAPAGLCEEQRDDCAEPHDYFNVLSYRSLGSFSFLVETG